MTETPQDFDFDAWLDGAERPERAVTVYQKANLIADLDALESRILIAEEEEGDPEFERQLSSMTESQKLQSEYRKLAQQFHDSALTIRVQGRSDDEKRGLAQANSSATGTDLAYVILADAVTSPRATPEQLRRLEKKIGAAQFGLVLAAFKNASESIPSVSADFLPKPSTRGDGGES
jgi:hypothetical protein